MKKNIHCPARLLILCLLVYGSCKKNEPEASFRFTYPPPKPATPQILYTNKTIRGTILEWGSDKPIAGAMLTLHSFNEDNNQGFSFLHLESDSLGNLQFDAHEFQPDSLVRTGYWNNYSAQYPGPAAEYFPLNTVFDDLGNSSDSFVLRLVPITNITIHLRDSSKSIDYDKLAKENIGVYFYLGGLQTFTQNNGLNSIYLYKGIDTTFKWRAFGNSENEIGVASFSEYDAVDTIINHVFYIPKNSDTAVSLTY